MGDGAGAVVGEEGEAGVEERGEAADAKGIEVLALLAYGNPWATQWGFTNDALYPPDDPADFAHFAGAVAARYAGQVSRYEIWNEENSGFRFWKPSADPAAYATLLHEASAAVHAADPKAQVAYGGLFFHGQAIMSATDFLTQSFAARPDLANDLDAFGFHPYPLYPPSVAPEAGDNGETPVDEMVSSLRAILDANGAKGKPMWATEYGWPDFSPVTPDLQAAYLVRETMWLAASHVPLACDFTLTDGPNAGQFPPEDSFGLYAFSSAVGGHGAIKPAGQAMQFLEQRLGNLEMVGSVKAKLGLGGGQYAFLLVGPNGDSWAYVLWSYDDKYAGSVVLPTVQGHGVQVLDPIGGPVQTESATGGIRVHFGTMPVVVYFGVMGCA